MCNTSVVLNRYSLVDIFLVIKLIKEKWSGLHHYFDIAVVFSIQNLDVLDIEVPILVYNVLAATFAQVVPFLISNHSF